MKTQRETEALKKAQRTRLIKLAVGVGIAVLAIWIISANYILNSRLAFAEEKQAQLENVLQRRYDLIPNLINVAKASAAHEKDLIASVGDLYQKLDRTGSFAERQTIEQDLEASVKKLMSALQADPEASSTALFIRLSDEMAGAENRIAVERKRYNEAAAIYNRAARGLFVGSMGRLFGYPGALPYFQASEQASKPPAF
jgi:LemA protein